MNEKTYLLAIRWNESGNVFNRVCLYSEIKGICESCVGSKAAIVMIQEIPEELYITLKEIYQ